MKTFLSLYRKPIFLFLFFLSLISGPAYNTYVHYDFSHSGDTQTYLKIANGDFNDSPVRRYRLIVPFMAKAVSYPIEKIYSKLWPHRSQNNWPLQLAFLLVNSFIMAIACLVIYYTCISYGMKEFSSLIAVIMIISSRWTNYIAALPLVDSLYLLIIALVVFGIKNKYKPALLFCIFLGPFAKESFIFIAPIILLCGYNVVRIPWQIFYFALSGLVVFIFHYLIDQSLGDPAVLTGVEAGVGHFEGIIASIKRIFSFKGLGEVMMIFSYFTLLIIPVIFLKPFRNTALKYLDKAGVLLLVSVLMHALLSQDIGRMLYLSAPVFAIIMAAIVEQLIQKYWPAQSSIKNI